MSNIAGGEPLGVELILRPDASKSTGDEHLNRLQTQIQYAAVRILGEISDENDEHRTPDDVRQAMIGIGQGDLAALKPLAAEHLERIALQLGDDEARITNLLGVVYVAHYSKDDEET